MRTWLITGVSSGFGRALAQQILGRGEAVIGTLRRADQAAAFEALAPGRASACIADLTDRANLGVAIGAAIDKAGRIDVVVNNAGYGLAGAGEEVSDAEMRQQMETNFFGLVTVTQAALPYLRRQGSGHVVNISSLAGFMGIAGMSLYSASKFAVEGFSEGLAAEVAHLGIRVTIVEPGAFRTSWSSAAAIVRAQRSIEAYAPSAGKLKQGLAALDGHQPGDPHKAARAIIAAVDAANPPLHLPLGADAVRALRRQLAQRAAELDRWEALSVDTAVGGTP